MIKTGEKNLPHSRSREQRSDEGVIESIQLCSTDYSGTIESPVEAEDIVARPAGVRRWSRRPLKPRGELGSRNAVCSSAATSLPEPHTMAGE